MKVKIRTLKAMKALPETEVVEENGFELIRLKKDPEVIFILKYDKGKSNMSFLAGRIQNGTDNKCKAYPFIENKSEFALPSFSIERIIEDKT